MAIVLISHTTFTGKYSPSSKQNLHNELMRAQSVGAISLHRACSPKYHGKRTTLPEVTALSSRAEDDELQHKTAYLGQKPVAEASGNHSYPSQKQRNPTN